MATYLVSCVAGFIASKVAELLLSDGHTVVGVDNLNEAYDVRFKHWRLRRLKEKAGFEFHHKDITDHKAMNALFSDPRAESFSGVINLAARAGVRQSVLDPWSYYEPHRNVKPAGTLPSL